MATKSASTTNSNKSSTAKTHPANSTRASKGGIAKARATKSGARKSNAGRKPIDEAGASAKRLPVFLTPEEKDIITERVGRGKASGWLRGLALKALKPLPIYGMVCCGDGISAVAPDEVKTVAFIEDLLPGTEAEKYILRASGDSMNNPRDRRLDIQDDDLLVFAATDTASNNQIVHYELVDEHDGRTCGVRFYREERDHIRLRAANDAVNPANQLPLYPEIVVHRDDIQIRGVWLRIAISGVRI